MALHAKNTRVIYGTTVLPANEDSIAAAVAAAETTIYSTHGARTYIPGLRDRAITVAGVADFSTSNASTDQVAQGDRRALENFLGSTTSRPLFISRGSTVGAYGEIVPYAGVAAYSKTSPLNDVINWSATLFNMASTYAQTGELRSYGARRLTSSTAYDSTGAVASVQHNSTAGSTNDAVYTLHVTDSTATGSTSFTWTIQHSSDDSSWSAISTGLQAVSTGARQSYSVGVVSADPKEFTRFVITGWSTDIVSANIEVGLARLNK